MAELAPWDSWSALHRRKMRDYPTGQAATPLLGARPSKFVRETLVHSKAAWRFASRRSPKAGCAFASLRLCVKNVSFLFPFVCFVVKNPCPSPAADYGPLTTDWVAHASRVSNSASRRISSQAVRSGLGLHWGCMIINSTTDLIADSLNRRSRR